MSGKTKAQLQAELDAENEKIVALDDVTYDARQARRKLKNRVGYLYWEEAQAKAKGDAYDDTANRFQHILDYWPND